MADKAAVLKEIPQARQRFSMNSLAAVWLGLLLVLAFYHTVRSMAGSWFDEPSNMEQGVFVPFTAAYMIWCSQDQLRRIVRAPSRLGVVLVLVSALVSLVSVVSQWIWLSRMAFLFAVIGCVWALYGFRMVRSLAYPLCTLLLMIQPPSFVNERITLQLQLLASRLGEMSLEVLGFSVLREGNVLEMVGEKLAVAEACSGIRSLMALIFLAVVYNYFFVPQKRMRWILLASVVPIAILCNAGRILATGIVGQYNRELAHGMLHATFGYFGLALGAALLLLWHQILQRWRLAGGKKRA